MCEYTMMDEHYLLSTITAANKCVMFTAQLRSQDSLSSHEGHQPKGRMEVKEKITGGKKGCYTPML